MKHVKNFWIGGVLLIIVVLLGFYYLMSGKEGQKADNSEWLCDRGVEGIQSICVENNSEKEELAFEKDDKGWTGNDGSFYRHDEFVSYTAALGYMKTEDKISTSGRETDYGLEKPTYTVSAVYEDGQTFSYSLGKYVEGLGMYIRTEDQSSIYLIDNQRGEVLRNMVGFLYEVLLTNVKFDEIRGISLYSPESGLISLNRSEAPRVNGNFYWNIYKPFAAVANTEEIKNLIDLMKNIKTMKRTEESLTKKECGLAEETSQMAKVTFYDTYDSELSIYIGNERGDDVYCSTNYLDGIYLISKDILKLLNFRVGDILETTLYYYEIPSVERCTIVWEKESYELKAEWAAANEEGERGQRYFLNGVNVTGDKYRTIIEWFLETKAVPQEDTSNSSGAILGTVTVERLSPPYEQTITFSAMPDNSTVQVDWGGSAKACIAKEKVENFIASLRQ